MNALFEFLSNLDTVATIALCAVVIALVTSIASIYQSVLYRKHNRLSVKPYISIKMNGRGPIGDYHEWTCTVINGGIGPAVINDCFVLYEGKQIGSNADIESLEKNIKDKVNIDKKITLQDITLVHPSSPLSVKDSITLLKIRVSIHHSEAIEAIEGFHNKFDFVFNYESMYEEKFTLDTRERRNKN